MFSLRNEFFTVARTCHGDFLRDVCEDLGKAMACFDARQVAAHQRWGSPCHDAGPINDGPPTLY